MEQDVDTVEHKVLAKGFWPVADDIIITAGVHVNNKLKEAIDSVGLHNEQVNTLITSLVDARVYNERQIAEYDYYMQLESIDGIINSYSLTIIYMNHTWKALDLNGVVLVEDFSLSGFIGGLLNKYKTESNVYIEETLRMK